MLQYVLVIHLCTFFLDIPGNTFEFIGIYSMLPYCFWIRSWIVCVKFKSRFCFIISASDRTSAELVSAMYLQWLRNCSLNRYTCWVYFNLKLSSSFLWAHCTKMLVMYVAQYFWRFAFILLASVSGNGTSFHTPAVVCSLSALHMILFGSLCVCLI